MPTLTGSARHLSGENKERKSKLNADPEARPSSAAGNADPEACPPIPAAPPHPPKGWFSRGYLPHFDAPNTIQHVTIHQSDSLPREVVRRMDAEIKAKPWYKRDPRRLEKIEKWLRAGHGSCILGMPAIAAMTQQTLLYFDGLRYRLMAWVVMPNHLHVLFEPTNGWPLNKIVASWKRHTAMEILAVHNLEKPVWHHELFDRFVRD